MVIQEKRKHARIQSLNLSYICLNENDEIVKQGMGRTLNVSAAGILLETNFAVDLNHKVLLNIGFQEQLIEVKGKPIHSKKNDKGLHEIGIQFQESDPVVIDTIQKFVEAYEKKSD